MATRIPKKTDLETVEEVETQSSEAPELDGLQAMIAELGGSANAKVTVHRVNKNRTQSYVFACTPEEFSLDTLRDQYGGGDFRLYITRNGQLIKGGNRAISVEPRHVPMASQSIEAPAAGGLAELTAIMREFQAQQLAMMQAIARPPASPFAGMDIPAVISAVTAAISVLRPPPAPMPPPAQVVDQSDRAINMLLKGIELAKDLNSGGGGERSMFDFALEAMKSPVVAAAVQAAGQPPAPQHQPQRPPQQRLPNPQAPQPPVVSHAKHSAPVQTQPPASPMQPTPVPHPPSPIVKYMALLTAKAAAGADASLYAEMVLDNLDDETIIGLLNREPNPLDALMADYPPANDHREWFESLIATIAAAYEDDGTGDGEGDGDDADDVPESGASIGVGRHAPGDSAEIIPGGDSAG